MWTKFLSRCRSSRPELPFEDEEVIESLAKWTGAVDEAQLSRLHAGDMLLALRCAQGDPRALRIFDDEIVKRLAFAPSEQAEGTSDEVRQGIRELLLVSRGGEAPRIAAYRGRGRLLSWVRTIARRMKMNRSADWRARRAFTSADGNEAVEMLGEHAELLYEHAESLAHFRHFLHAAIAELEEVERRVLRMHYLEGANLDAIAQSLGVSRATAGRVVVRLRERLVARVDAPGANASAFADHLSLRRILASRPKDK